MLTFSNNVEPANGFLVRYLRRKLLESDTDINANKEELLRVLDWVPKLWYHLHTFLEKHSTSDFLIGTALPCLPPLPQAAGSPGDGNQALPEELRGADMFPLSPSATNHSWWVMHTSIALSWVVFVPLGAVTRGVSQGWQFSQHPSLGMEHLCVPRRIPPCFSRLLGDRLNLAAPFLAWEMLSAC